ncbi:MAG TPA: beta-aspartyl-peptidase [Patescibacteria group bacterium]|nr:beta-aspartyl-peptidase [Patescibacteria group bacterium]
MFKLIRNIEVYNPTPLGRMDILTCHDKIIKLSENIDFPSDLFNTEIIDGTDYKAVPGFIDQHVHFIGGGGEGGPATRTPEIQLSALTTAGITTAVGLLGTDGITRSMAALLAKARALEIEGISTFIYSGCYEIPTQTITGTVKSDLIFIDKVIGTGELAISDHRSSQPNFDDVKKIAAEARVGGILSGKCGIVHLHLGDGLDGIKILTEIIRSTEIPIKQFMPSHINRVEHLLVQSMDYLRLGGYVDITSDFYKTKDSPTTYSIADSLKLYVNNNIPLDRVCASSDSNGSTPVFDNEGHLVKIGVGSPAPLYKDVKNAIEEGIVTLEQGISIITSNPAKALMLYPRKGALVENADADIVLLNKKLDIDTVIARGQIMVKEGKAVVKGFFESV